MLSFIVIVLRKLKGLSMTDNFMQKYWNIFLDEFKI